MTSHRPPRATPQPRAHGADRSADDRADSGADDPAGPRANDPAGPLAGPLAGPPFERPRDEAPDEAPDGAFDEALDRMLDGPLLQVPDDFDVRVLAALPASDAAIARTAAGTSPTSPVAPDVARSDATRSRTARAWRLVQALLLAACGAAGAVEVLLFVGGLWTATAVAVG